MLSSPSEKLFTGCEMNLAGTFQEEIFQHSNDALGNISDISKQSSRRSTARHALGIFRILEQGRPG